MFEAAVLRSEATIVAALGDVTDRGRYVRFRTPGMPSNIATNGLIFREEPGPAAAIEWPELAAMEFVDYPPGCRYRLGWDGPKEARPEVVAALEKAGLSVFTVCVLATDRPAPGPTDGFEVRRLESQADWTDAIYTSALVAPAPPGPKTFKHHQGAMATYRSACEAGHGAFFGAWQDGACLGLLGIFVDAEGLGRYQWIVVAPHHRRRGVCRALLAAAAAWADARRYVVLGFANNPLGLGAYRGAGFKEVERQTWFWRQ
jgi:GNAT superfamily N-acetyltransferase